MIEQRVRLTVRDKKTGEVRHYESLTAMDILLRLLKALKEKNILTEEEIEKCFSAENS